MLQPGPTEAETEQLLRRWHERDLQQKGSASFYLTRSATATLLDEILCGSARKLRAAFGSIHQPCRLGLLNVFERPRSAPESWAMINYFLLPSLICRQFIIYISCLTCCCLQIKGRPEFYNNEWSASTQNWSAAANSSQSSCITSIYIY